MLKLSLARRPGQGWGSIWIMKQQNNLLLNFSAAVTKFLFLSSLLLVVVNGFAQMDKWILNPYEIDFEVWMSNLITCGS